MKCHCVDVPRFLCSSADGWLGWLHFLGIVNSTAVNMAAQIATVCWFAGLRIYTLGIQAESQEFYLLFYEKHLVWFRYECASLYSPGNANGFFPLSSPGTGVIATLKTAVKWNLTAILIRVFLIAKDVEHFFKCLLAIPPHHHLLTLLWKF